MKIALTIALFILSASINAQRVVVIEPEAVKINGLAASVRTGIGRDFKILDHSMAEAAFRSVTLDDPFNLSTSDARRVGEVRGVDKFILLRSAIQRRASIGRPAYFEAYAIAYVVDSRTGSLIGWFRASAEADNENEGREKLVGRAKTLTDQIGNS